MELESQAFETHGKRMDDPLERGRRLLKSDEYPDPH